MRIIYIYGGGVRQVLPLSKKTHDNVLFDLKREIPIIIDFGLSFKITSGYRSPESQMKAVLNKYKGNGASEIKKVYGQPTLDAVKAYSENPNDPAIRETFRNLCKSNTGHGSGKAVDIRSYWYDDEAIRKVLKIIRSLDPKADGMLEPMATRCWEKAGWKVENAKRTPDRADDACYNEHIHIKIPSTYKSKGSTNSVQEKETI